MNSRKRLALYVLLALTVSLASGCGTTPTAFPTAATALPAAATGSTPSGPLIATAGPGLQANSPQARTELAMSLVERPEAGTILARVNGTDISWEEYEPLLRQGLYNINSTKDVNWADAAMQQKLKQLQNDVLKQAADRLLLREMAQAQGISAGEEQVQAQVDSEKETILSSGRYADWNAFLQDNGMTEKTFRDMITDTLLVNKLAAAQQVETQAEQVHLRHIGVADEQTANAVEAKLKAGHDFGALVNQYSIDEQTKGTGGDLGWFLPEAVTPEFRDAALSLPVGAFSEPIPTQLGYTIVQVMERGMHELEPVILRQRQQQALLAALEQVRAQATIEYLVDFLATQAP